MYSYKVRVNNEAESKEVQELFFELGGDFYFGGKIYCNTHLGLVTINKDGLMANIELDGFEYKELTTQQLRDLVVLKRNCVGDATHYLRDMKYISIDSQWYYFSKSKSCWLVSKNTKEQMLNLKPIEKEMKMKEYLEQQADGSYELVLAYRKEGNDWIEVPDGAVKAVEQYIVGRPVAFINDSGEYWSIMNKKWCAIEGIHNREVLWQRSEVEPTLNEQYAEIEQVRQELNGIDATLAERKATYGCFEDVAFITESIMSILANARASGINDLPNTHRMALYMIASKMARIVNGDFNHKDSWHDIGGYAKLVEDLL